MVNRKSGKAAGPSAKKTPGRAALPGRPDGARATLSRPAGRTASRAAKPVVAHAGTPKKTTSGNSTSRPAAAVRAAAKGVRTTAAAPKATSTRPGVRRVSPGPLLAGKAASAKAASRPASPAGAAAPRDDAARRKFQLLEQEKAELQNLGNRMKAELDSALAEAEALRERLRAAEAGQARQPAAEGGAARPAGFDAAVDLDEDIPAPAEDDLDETAGFFDRMDEIRARRNELDRERNDRELEQSDQPFWMICPKCGDLMEESEGENVKLERCENCGGLYLDRGEVDLILSLTAGPDAYRRLHNILKF